MAEAAPASPAVLPGEDAGGPHVPYASDQEAAGYAGLRGSGGAGGGSPVAATNCVAAASGGAADGAEEGSVARVKGLDVRQGAGAGAGESPQAAADDSTSAAAAAGAAGAAPHSSDVGSEMLASSMEAAGPQGAGGEAGATGSMGKGTEGKGTAGKGTAGKGTAGKGTGLGAPLQPRGPPSEGPAVARELEQLARRLRGSVGDVTLRLEAVIGSGAFGTVFKGGGGAGTWLWRALGGGGEVRLAGWTRGCYRDGRGCGLAAWKSLSGRPFATQALCNMTPALPPSPMCLPLAASPPCFPSAVNLDLLTFPPPNPPALLPCPGTWQGLSVAVKTVVFSATNDRKRRALQEAALCQAVSHPNIVVGRGRGAGGGGGGAVPGSQPPKHSGAEGGRGSKSALAPVQALQVCR